MLDLAQVTHADFEDLVGERFQLTLDSGGSIVLELVEVDARGRAGDARQARQPFALTFRGPPQPVLVQQIYRVEHHTLGVAEIFLVPRGPSADHMRYEAVFS